MEILQEIAKQMGLTYEDLRDKKVMHEGDWLTTRNMWYPPALNIRSLTIRSAIGEQEESLPENQLRYVEPITGLFHFGLTIVGLLFLAHERRNDEFGSMVYWMNWVKRTPNMWDMKTKKVKNFHQCNAFLSHLTDAHLLAAVATELGVYSWEGI